MAATCRANSCCACSRVKGGGIVIVTGAIVVPVAGVAAPVLVPELGESMRTLLLPVCVSGSIRTTVASLVSLVEEGEEGECGGGAGADGGGVVVMPGDDDEAMCARFFWWRGRERERDKGTVEIATDQDEEQKKRVQKTGKNRSKRGKRRRGETSGGSKTNFQTAVSFL